VTLSFVLRTAPGLRARWLSYPSQTDSGKHAMELAGSSRGRAGCDVRTGVTLRRQFASRNNRRESYDESQYFLESTKVYSREKGEEARDRIQERDKENERKRYTKRHRLEESSYAKIALWDSRLKILGRVFQQKKSRKILIVNIRDQLRRILKFLVSTEYP